MKNLLLTSSLISCLFVSCSQVSQVQQQLSQQLSSPLQSETDPLDSPMKNLKSGFTGANGQRTSGSSSGSVGFSEGQLVETAMPNAEFFRKYPLFGRGYDRKLDVATKAKVYSQRGKYTKVELDSGDVGYIPSISLIERIGQDPSYYAPVESQRVPETLPSDPPPPSEDEILRKIKEREEASRAPVAPEPEVPTISTPPAPAPAPTTSTPTTSSVAPAPEVLGIGAPTPVQPSTPVAPPTIPSVPQTVPQVAAPEIVAPPLPKNL